MATTWQQVHFRFRNDDGSESAATWKAAADTNVTADVSGGDVSLRVRFNIRETGTTSATFSARLYYSLNGGAYAQINASGTPVVASASGNLTDDASTTQQISSGTFVAGKVDDVNAQTGSTGTIAQNNDTEFEFMLTVSAASVANSDTIDLRVRRGTVALTTYTVTARITVKKDVLAGVGSATFTGFAPTIPPPGLSGPVTDNFDRANNASLGSNWTTPSGTNAIRINSNQAAGNATLGGGAAYWSANAFNDDQYSKCIPIGLAAGGRYEYAGVRMGGANGEGYYAKTDGTNSWLVYINAAGAESTLATFSGTGFNGSTDILEIRAVGTAIRFYKNGSQIGSDATDSNIASGYAGFLEAPDNNTAIDSWEGGNVTSGTTVLPDVGILSFAGFAAAVAITANVLCSPGVGTGTFSAFAPTVGVSNNQVVLPGAGLGSFSGFAPSVTIGTNVLAGVGSATFAGQAPTIGLSDNKQVLPGVGAASFAGFAPTVAATDYKVVLPGVGSATFAGFAPTPSVSNNQVVLPGVGSATFTGFSPTVTASDHKQVLPGTGVLTFTGQAPALDNSITVQPGAGDVSISGFAPTVLAPRNVLADVGAVSITGFAPTVFASDNQEVQPGTGLATFEGFAPDMGGNREVLAGFGSLVLAGFAPSVIAYSPSPRNSAGNFGGRESGYGVQRRTAEGADRRISENKHRSG